MSVSNKARLRGTSVPTTDDNTYREVVGTFAQPDTSG
jgi:hypothetical protein